MYFTHTPPAFVHYAPKTAPAGIVDALKALRLGLFTHASGDAAVTVRHAPGIHTLLSHLGAAGVKTLGGLA